MDALNITEANTAVQTFTACFLYPGVARYDKDTTLQMVLIDKHIDGIAKSFIGAPMTIGHTNPADLPMGDPKIVGRVTNVFLNSEGFTTKQGAFVEADNKYYCDFYLDKAEAIEQWARLGFVSCAWEGVEFIRPERNDKGQLEKLSYINVEYEAELKVARALHMAIVAEPRYEQSIIYKNSMSQEKEVTSTIEIEKGVYLNYISSTAEKAKDLVLSIFENARKAKKKNEDAYDDDMEEEESKENSKKMKNAKKNESEDEKEETDKMENSKKAKKNESEEKETKEEKKENAAVSSDGWSGDWSEEDKKEKGKEKKDEKDTKDTKDTKDAKEAAKKNSIEVDEEELALVENYRNAKKAKKNESEDKKEEKENSVTKTNGGFALEEARNKIAQPKIKASAYVKGSDLFS